MNVFGRLAEFIWDYQEEIQIAFIIIVIAAAIYVVARMVRASRKKRSSFPRSTTPLHRSVPPSAASAISRAAWCT